MILHRNYREVTFSGNLIHQNIAFPPPAFSPPTRRTRGCKQSSQRTCLCASVHLHNLCFHHHHCSQAFPFVIQISAAVECAAKAITASSGWGRRSGRRAPGRRLRDKTIHPYSRRHFFMSVAKVNIRCECEAIWSSSEEPDRRRVSRSVWHQDSLASSSDPTGNKLDLTPSAQRKRKKKMKQKQAALRNQVLSE